MGSVISKWIVPGVVTVIIGTIAALFFTQSNIEEDLTQKSQAVINSAGDQTAADWAKITFDARDGTISGLSTDADAAQNIIAQISAIPGVRSLTSDIEIAPTISPFPFSAVLNEGVISLSGSVPGISVRDALLAQTGAKDAGLELTSGVPEGDWQGAAAFAVSQLNGLESGQATLSDLSLSVTGLAKTIDDYSMTTATLMGNLPSGLTLETAVISPALVENFIFSATLADGMTMVSGFVPDETTRLKVGELTGAAEDLQLASGAPENFQSSLDYALKLLGTTTNGEISLNGTELSFSGTAASRDNFEMAGSLLSSEVPQGLELKSAYVAPPLAEPYFWFVQKAEDGIMSVFGNAANQNTRAALMRRAGENAVDRMQISSGAPETFYADALSAITALSNLDSGRAGFAGNSWYLNGNPDSENAITQTQDALLSARTALADWKVNIADAPPVPVVPYLWSADKFSNGTIILNGNVPDDTTRAAILARAGEGAIDNMQTSFGAPETFYEDALVAISALESLATGRAGHSINGWFLFGQAADMTELENSTNALITARTPADKWRVEFADIPEPEPEIVVEAAPVVEVPAVETVVETDMVEEGFSFDANLSKEDGISLSGQVPNMQVATYLGLISGSVSTENLATSPEGAPDNFALNAGAGIRALLRLSEGNLKLDDDIWAISGTAATREARTDALAQITPLANAGSWKLSVIIPAAIEICRSQISALMEENTIKFDTGSARISQTSLPTLQQLAAFLKQCPNSSANIEGHTDDQGDFVSNLKLSIDRADSVVDALVKMGIDADRLLSIGFGQDRPIASNETEEGRQQNRRIVIQILD